MNRLMKFVCVAWMALAAQVVLADGGVRDAQMRDSLFKSPSVDTPGAVRVRTTSIEPEGGVPGDQHGAVPVATRRF